MKDRCRRVLVVGIWMGPFSKVYEKQYLTCNVLSQIAERKVITTSFPPPVSIRL